VPGSVAPRCGRIRARHDEAGYPHPPAPVRPGACPAVLVGFEDVPHRAGNLREFPGGQPVVAVGEFHRVTPRRGLVGPVREEPGGQLACGRIRTDAERAGAVTGGAALMSLGMLGFGAAPAVSLLVPLSLLTGAGNGLVNVCVATLVTTRTAERMRGRVAAALGAVLNTASVASLAAGGALAAVLDPRQVYLLAGGLGAAVTAVLVVRCTAWLGLPRQYFVRE
jgi:hypothetical protein